MSSFNSVSFSAVTISSYHPPSPHFPVGVPELSQKRNAVFQFTLNITNQPTKCSGIRYVCIII